MPSINYIASLAHKEASRLGYCPKTIETAYGNIVVSDFLSSDAITAIDMAAKAHVKMSA